MKLTKNDNQGIRTWRLCSSDVTERIPAQKGEKPTESHFRNSAQLTVAEHPCYIGEVGRRSLINRGMRYDVVYGLDVKRVELADLFLK